jgi:ACR3 family arsenite transporter
MTASSPLGFFEKNLTFWVLICIGLGTLLGNFFPDFFSLISTIEFGGINLIIVFLVWGMIYPMMVQIDFRSIKNFKQYPKGLALTIIVNWLIKPFSMAVIAWFFLSEIFNLPFANDYIAGAILLGAAPCTAMVFVWSYLSKGNAVYTLIQVSINDLLILLFFIPIVGFLLDITNIAIPYTTLLSSIILFVIIPLSAGWLSNRVLIKRKGEVWFTNHFLNALKPLSIITLLLTLIILFALQGKVILNNPLIIILIAIPLTVQTYLIFFVSWFSGKWLKLPYAICAPAAMIGASNFFELAVAVAISLFGLNSGAALTTVVGVLVEVPIMLSLVAIANKWQY